MTENNEKDDNLPKYMYTEEREEIDNSFSVRDIDCYEEAISKAGYGRFNYWLLFTCGLGILSDSTEVYSVSFIIPPATCELNLSSTDKGWINSCNFLGMVLGGFMWGILADRIGRREALICCLTTNADGGMISSFVQQFWAFTFLRFISGIGVGGSLPVFFAYFGEFQSKENRGSKISILSIAWPIGTIFAAGMAWFIIPYRFGIFTSSFTYNSWRIYLTLCTLPSIISLISLIWMPESPKFLIDKRKEVEALHVLQKVYELNHPGVSASEMLDLRLSHASRQPFAEEKLPYSLIDQLLKIVKLSVKILRPPVLKNTLLIVSTNSCFSIGYYGLFLWLPELFKRVKVLGGSPCLHEISTLNTLGVNETDVCSYNSSDSEIYFDTFLTAISGLPSNIITVMIIDRIGRRFILGPSLILSGLSVFLLYGITAENGTLIISCILSGLSGFATVCLKVLGVELFPTHLRSTGSGFVNSTGRIAVIIGNTIFGLLIDSNCAIPLSLVASFLCIGGVSGFFMPEFRKEDIH